MTDALARARDEVGEVLEVERLGLDLFELVVRLPHLAATAEPGQFSQLCAEGGGWPLLRRPFSVAWTEEDRCSFVLAPVGAGTTRLAALRPGDRLRSLGPLGRGFTLPAPGGAAVCVSGGLGCAPFPLLLRALRAAGVERLAVLSGAATAGRLYPAARFQRGDAAIAVAEATDDASRGHGGRVTELAAGALGPSTSALYACGPNPMLAALAATVLAPDRAPPIAEASMEAPMGCGFGTCLGCALPVRRERGAAWALCCREGPAMPIRTLDWERVEALPPPGAA